jgi:hypothetical protein
MWGLPETYKIVTHHFDKLRPEVIAVQLSSIISLIRKKTENACYTLLLYGVIHSVRPPN